ncbi:Glyoxylate/hydroxypyruvate reductase [Gigaspora margarita]|uniref:Glyoxylate/hydroxypyruvate reductase n=1 Tax=Gigaspora margarita TaxID=4874 RepID=A0A8H3X3X3_GIGMA|nr:Glyoxylate/hydroxypyruvate reductase [Gigaspora margarita]
MAFADDSKKYSAVWNIYRMVESVNSPVVSFKSELRHSIRVPGLVICGRTLNWSAECYKSKFNAADDNYTTGTNCNEYLSSPIDATIFVNMRGYDDLDKLYCYILNTSQPFNESYGTNSLEFSSSTQKIAIALWSNEETNNTITEDRWFVYGTFTELEDYKYTKFQIVKMPSISYLYFKRIEKYGINKKDIITGGGTGQTIQKSIESDETFTSFAISGFDVNKHLWEIFRIIPAKYVNNEQSNSTEYLVQLWYDRVEFTFFQLTANMGGFLSVLSVIYLFLFGSRRINPWGVVQRHLLKAVPPTLESYSSLTESIDPQIQEKDSPEETHVFIVSRRYE